VDVRIREIKPSARRHKISDERIRAAVRACPRMLYVDDPLTGEDDLVMFFGPDGNANPLEVMGREHDDGSVTIFHAMSVRPRYRDLYEQVTGIR
jgi:hypothetical protein